ncbi:MAG: efflux RND transporter periplasmic adaptor subunit [Sulfuricaulis sp.]|uniref:efflux RND transporter periplasmic adaptor subunit n=1 Tax=Sulfuricaulis sp. TaxID=2003553 RepID=UPI0025F87629|nr:efflux RND transporter periplasmic adaptor subunit [Sulfuricaulis sp.]MCR4347344.1 efflux RND transporter periplasmic adaptor subunit [Sulfuricaulis sp.]
MKRLHVSRRTLALVAVLVPMLALFIYVVLRSGPLAPVPVTVAAVENRSIAPALFGIGTVEARYLYKIGPTVAGRVRRVEVQVGEHVQAGQLLGEMDPVDLDERLQAQDATLKRAEAAAQAAAAQVSEAAARKIYAVSQARRYEKLLQAQSASEETVEAKRQERQLALAGFTAAEANREAARQELARARAERDGLQQQRANLRLVAPVAGLVAARHADPGTTVVAGQAVVELIDPASLWINVRFDQLRASGLRADLSARITLRSQGAQEHNARVLRVEPLADAVTEETLAKVVFDSIPDPLPPIGELAEVTVALPPLPAAPAVPNASVQRVDGRLGVWLVDDGALRFTPIKVGATDLDGKVQILEGLKIGERVVVYSQRSLNSHSRIKIVEQLPGVTP